MTKKSARKSSPKANALTVQRVFNASPKTLWTYWTDSERFAKWFNPAPGLDLVIHEYDVRPGGRVRFDMPQPDGNKNPQEGVFHVLKPYREIVSGAPDKSFLVAVRFRRVERRTRMTVTVKGIPPKFREGAGKGWNAGFEKLADALEDEATEDRAIATTRVFDAPRDVVWRMWTEPDQIAQWWGPDGFTNSIDSMDVRPGGIWKFVMHGPDGRDYENEIEYVEVTKPKRLVYDHGPSPRFRTTVTFVDLGTKTKLTMRAVFSTAAIRDKVAKEYGAIEGGKQTLGRLANHLAKRAAGVREVEIARVFHAPRERVWRAWTDPGEVKKWWGPKGFIAPEIRIDFRVGGRFVYCMRGAGMDAVVRDYWNTGEHREIVPLEKIVATMSFADEHGNAVPASHYGMPGDWPPEILLTATFEDIGEGRTRVTVREVGVPEAMSGFAGLGWSQSLDKFAAILRSSAQSRTAAAERKTSLTLTFASDRQIVITRIFDAPRERVYWAYTDPKAIPEWWGPKGYTTRVEAMDVRPGGAWRYVQHDTEGREHAFRGVYREVEPPERISQSFEYEGTPGHIVEETTTFEEVRGGKTKVTVRGQYASKEDRDEMLSAGMEWGLRESYERLEALLARRA